MKGYHLTLLAGILVITGSALIPQSAVALCIKAKLAYIRSGPGKKHKKVWEVYRYMPFREVSEKDSWLKVKDFEGEINWVHKNLTTKEHMCAVVKIESENIRRAPVVSKKNIIGKAKKYYSYKVLELKKKWAKVQDEHGDSYWIHRSALWIN